MSQQRAISSYFSRSTPGKENNTSTERATSLTTSLLESSSPLSSCSPIPSSAFATPDTVRRTSSAHIKLREAISSEPEENFEALTQSITTTTSTSTRAGAEAQSFQSSFSGSSQRVVRDGKVVVTNTDSDTDSIDSLETPEELLARFSTKAKPDRPETESDTGAGTGTDTGSGMGGSNTKKNARKRLISTEVPKYSFSLGDLVHDAVDDNEMQENVRKAKEKMELTTRELEKSKQDAAGKRRELLVSMMGDDADPAQLQRFNKAIERTEALDETETFSFFEETVCPPSPFRFPQKCISPGYWGGVLRDSSSRERAFLSGIVGEFLADGGLPDELILWILHAVTVEARDELRYAYCSSVKLIPAERLSRLINPSHMEQMFRRIGAESNALATEEVVKTNSGSILLSHEPRDYRRLLSVLDIVGGISNKLNYTTREHVLKILLRLVLDEKCMDNSAVCVAAQDAIVSLFKESEDQLTDLSLYEISMGLYKTIRKLTLQNQLLKQVIPVTPRIALFRIRLALAFLYQDPSPLDKPKEHLIDLKRIRSQVYGPRFDVTRRHVDSDSEDEDKWENAKKKEDNPVKEEHNKAIKEEDTKPEKKSSQPLDYHDFAALTSILDIAIDAGTTHDPAIFDKKTEERFNRHVDRLAGAIKALFTSIQDSGASHLKRVEAKECLQALHFRLLYGVRTKEKPKKSFFEMGSAKQREKQKRMMETWIKKGEKVDEQKIKVDTENTKPLVVDGAAG